MMDDLPNALVEHILSDLQDARDIARCTCVSRLWKESMPCIRSLYFPRSSFENKRTDPDAIVGRMIASSACLEELTIYCPFSPRSLEPWLLKKGPSLKRLELRVDSLNDARISLGGPVKLDSIGYAKGLEDLKLWGVSMDQSPNWGLFQRLQTLEIVGIRSTEGVLSSALQACPNICRLTLLGCEGVRSLSIELQRLEQCKVDFYEGDCSFTLSSPKLELLDVQGCSRIRVKDDHSLQNLTIANSAGKVSKVEVGRLAAVDYLYLSGLQWSWSTLSSILQNVTEVKHLVMKIEFCGDSGQLQPFPKVDLVEFFNSHPKLRIFEIHGAMFAAFCMKRKPTQDSRFTIDCLEEVLIKVRSPLNADQKVRTLKNLIKYSRKLRKMVIRVTGMKNCNVSSDEFFEEIFNFGRKNQKIVRIE